MVDLAANRNFKGKKPKTTRRIVCWFCRVNECARCMDSDHGVVCICEDCHPERSRDKEIKFEDGGNFKPKTERKQYDAKQVARELEVDPKKFRKFLRSAHSPVPAAGQGGRYLISRDDLAKVCYAYQHWAKRQDHSRYRRPKADPQADIQEP